MDEKGYIFAISPDNNLLAVLCDKKVKIYDMTGNLLDEISLLNHGMEYATKLIFSPDNKFLCINYYLEGNTVTIIYDLLNKTIKHTINRDDCFIDSDFSHDNMYFASGSYGNNTIYLYDLIKKTSLKLPIAGYLLAFSPNSKFLITVDQNLNTTLIYDLNNKIIIDSYDHTDLRIPTYHADRDNLVRSITFSPDSRYCITTFNNTLRLYDLNLKKIHDINYTSWCKSVMFSKDSEHIFTAHGNGAVNKYSLTKKALISIIPANKFFEDNICSFSVGGKYFISANEHNIVCIDIYQHNKILYKLIIRNGL